METSGPTVLATDHRQEIAIATGIGARAHRQLYNISRTGNAIWPWRTWAVAYTRRDREESRASYE